MRRCLFVVVGFFVVPSAASAEEKTPRTGKRSDDHGNITWVSTAERSEDDQDDWIYARTVTNRDKTRRCRIRWKISGTEHRSLIEPDSTETLSEVTIRMPPDEADGTMFYNGGRAAGEASSDAPAWAPKGPPKEEARLTARVRVSFERNDAVLTPVVSASSMAMQKGGEVSFLHELRIENVDELPKLAVRWTSIESKPFLQEFGGGGMIDRETKRLRLNEGSFKVGYGVSGRSALHDGVVQFVDDDGRVLGATWLPAFGPASGRDNR